MTDRLLKLKTPLETIDMVADIANQVARAPGRVAGNALVASGQAFKNVQSDIAKPADYPDIPPPPDVIVESAVAAGSHIVDGVIQAAKGAVDGVVETADGIKKEIQEFTGR